MEAAASHALTEEKISHSLKRQYQLFMYPYHHVTIPDQIIEMISQTDRMGGIDLTKHQIVIKHSSGGTIIGLGHMTKGAIV